MQKIFLLAGMVLSVSLLNARPFYKANDDTARADATIRNATVYFGYGAELTHDSKVKVTPGTKIIVINYLSTAIDMNSLQVSMPGDVALLSQKYRIHYPQIPEIAKSRQIKTWEDSIEVLQKEISRIETNISIEQETLSKTGLLIESTTGNKNLSSAEVLKLVDFYTAKIEKSKLAIYNYQQANMQKRNVVADLNTKIKNEINSNSVPKEKPYGQLLLQVICTKAIELPLSFSYYTNNAGWTPVYDIRVNSTNNKVKLVYKASLTQTTGIDWKKTKLTLSTGTPNFGVSAPVLSPWYLQLYVPGLYTDLQRRAAVGNAQRNVLQSMKDEEAFSEVVVTALQGKVSGLEVRPKTPPPPPQPIDPSTLQQFTTLSEGQLNTSFEIDLPYDIESDGELHNVNIKDEEIACILKNYAVPRVDKDAYLLAEVADWQNLDLLPGDANIIMDDTYIGKSVIDPNTTSDTLNLSLGRDKRLAVKRSLIKELSSIKTSGKDSRQTFTYEIIVKNNKLTDVNLLLKDQYPLSTIKEVEVKLDDKGEAMVNEETGVLTWKINLKPGESKKVRFSYTVKYPKDQRIVNLK